MFTMTTTAQKWGSSIGVRIPQRIAKMYGGFEREKFYCIKGQEQSVFSLSDYSWSLVIQSKSQLKESMKYENPFRGYRERKKLIHSTYLPLSMDVLQ